jgi:hypothetical protein
VKYQHQEHLVGQFSQRDNDLHLAWPIGHCEGKKLRGVKSADDETKIKRPVVQLEQPFSGRN